jgi:hypothetical protein
MEPLTFAAQLNAIKTLTQMAHASAVAGDRLESVKLLNRAQGMMTQALATPVKVVSVVPVVPKEKEKKETKRINYNTLFDEIAVAQLGKKYNKATDAQRTVIQDLARRVMEGQEREAA